MSDVAISAPGAPIIRVSYAPFRFMEAVPWLMLASALRLVGYSNRSLAISCDVLSSIAIFLAFLLAARRMIEFADGKTQLGKLDFEQQIWLAGRVLWRIGLLILVMTFVVTWLGAFESGSHMLLGFDGIAFDQHTRLGMVWSSVLAGIVLLMVVTAGDARAATLLGALKELARRARWMLPAIAAVAAFQFALNYGQGGARWLVWAYWRTSADPENIKSLVYFAFIFGFATIRLWGTLVILTLALRESYRHGD